MKRGLRTVAASPPVPSNRLQEVREGAGLTIAELVRITGVSDRSLRDIERGVRQARKATLHKIVNGLNDYLRSKGKREFGFAEVFPPNQTQAG